MSRIDAGPTNGLERAANAAEPDHSAPTNIDNPIVLPTGSEIRRSGLSSQFQEQALSLRKAAIAALRQMPSVISAIKSIAADGQIYRVIVSKENAHLLTEGADGIIKSTLRDAHGRFIENVDLIRITPDIAGHFVPIIVQATLAEIAAKLDAVMRTVEDLQALIRLTNQGRLHGAINALEVARLLKNADDRRAQVLSACRLVIEELGALAGQMNAHVALMPTERTTFWHGWKSDGVADAEIAYSRVRDDLAIVAEGLQRALAVYLELGEYDAASEALTRISASIDNPLRVAADRARLLPYPKEGRAPEDFFQSFLRAKPVIQMRLRDFSNGSSPAIAVEFQISELTP